MKLFLSLLLVVATAGSAFAQTAVLEGRLVNSLSGDPIRAATVVIDEAKREACLAGWHVSVRQPRARHVSRVGAHGRLFPASVEVTVPAAEWKYTWIRSFIFRRWRR